MKQACIAAAMALLLAAACRSLPFVAGSAPAVVAVASQTPPSLLNNASGLPTRTPFQPLFPTPVPPTNTSVPPTAAPTSTMTPTSTVTPAATVTPNSYSVWVDQALPAALKNALLVQPPFVRLDAPEAGAADLRLEVSDAEPLSRWVYALAAPFPTVADSVSSEDLLRAWRGEGSPPFISGPLLADESTARVFERLWGLPGPGAVQVVPPEELLAAAWERRQAWAILPFETLGPRWKVLEVDGRSPLRKDFDPSGYPLVAPISWTGERPPAGEPSLALPATNRDPSRLTTLAMTGVTALVRATAYTMETQGITYPGRDIGDWLRSADLLHISNEVPFAENCPAPDPVQADMRFCSDSRYIGLLEDVGADVIELTGDHFQDWGEEAMHFTLDLYRQRGWGYYGGGADLEDARRALIREHNGNRLAFIGCNAKGGYYAQAAPDHAGAVKCDLDWMGAEISRLRSQGYLPVATFQHFEYYTYRAQANQQRDSRALAEAGAVIVSGSQAHQPQGMEFAGDAFIHYGLGNLFFDQYDVSEPARQGFIDRHVFYDGRYVGTDLLTIQFVDYARPRPMTADERSNLLKTIFSASDW